MKLKILLWTLIIGFLLIFAIAFWGCATQPGAGKITVQPNTVYLKSDGWVFSYGVGMPTHPSASGNDWSFNFPTKPSEVHSLAVPYGQNVIHKTMTITFKITSVNPIYDGILGDKSNTCATPANFHLYFQAQNPNMSGDGGRWWSAASYTLGSRDNTIITLSVPMDAYHWSGVFGESGAKATSAFNEAWKNVGGIGITFGGGCFFGHGADLTSGKAQFQLVDFKVQ